MRKNKYDEREAKIRSLKRRKDEIWDIQRNNCWAKLDEPEPHGWYVRMKLRDDISRRSDADTLEEVLYLVEAKLWNKEKAFGYRVRGHTCTYTGLPNWQELHPWDGPYHNVRYGINYRVWVTLRPEVRRWFTPPEIIDYWGRAWCTCNVPIWYWDRYIERAYATHYKEIFPELESEEKYIENHIEGKYFQGYWYNKPRRATMIYSKGRRAKNKQALKRLEAYDYDESMVDFHDKERNSWNWY